MKIIISPSKKLSKKNYKVTPTAPIFNKKAIEIANRIRKYNKDDLKHAYRCSDKIAEEVYGMYQNFNTSTYPALYLYDGIQYKNINIQSLDDTQLSFLDTNLFIADALYGLLRATDSISNYRLDFNSKFQFSTLTYYKNEIGKIIKEPFINLCSQEYSEIIPKDLAINISFIQTVKGISKSYSTYTKIERGKFVKYLAEKQDTQLSTLLSYNKNGYKLDKKNSYNNNIIYKKYIS